MRYRIEVSRVGNGRRRIDDSVIRRAVRETLRAHACPSARIGVLLVNDAHIAVLNHGYLGHRGPTDVLTFPMNDEPGDAPLEGELVVSVETAARESTARRHALTAEVCLYVVHGVLHLLGYDDKTRRGSAAMRGAERRILTRLGYDGVYAAERRTESADRGRR